MAEEVKKEKVMPVAIVAPESMPVTVTNLPPEVAEAAAAVKEGKAERVQPQELLPSKPADTTYQQDLTLAGQRNINLKWEGTQQIIAIGVTAAVLFNCSFILMFGSSDLRQAAFIFLTNIAFLIIGTYFQRTNHTKTGGVGPNEMGR